MAPLIPPGFAVVGTGGSGTTYLSLILRANAVDCGHEEWWTPLGHPRSGLDGDSSWLAVPDIETGAWSGPVLHVARHPVGVVRNLLGGIFSDSARYPQFRRFALEHEPDLADTQSLEAAVEWWARWNARCAAVADLTVRIEDLLARLDVVEQTVGYVLNPRRTRRVPRSVNHRVCAPVDEAEIWRLLNGRAARFGYEEEPCG